MVLVGLNQAVPGPFALLLAGGGVEVDLNGDQGLLPGNAGVVEPVVALLLALSADRPDELNDAEGEVQGDAGSGAAHGGVQGGGLGDELLEPGGGEAVTLQHVQEDLRAVHGRADVAGIQGAAAVALHHLHVGGGHDHAVLQLLELHHQLGASEHDGHQGQGIAGGLGEVEGQGHVQGAGGIGGGNEVVTAVVLTNHLGQALAGLAGQLLPHEQVVIVQGVNGLGADDQGRAPDDELADGIHPVSPGVLVTHARPGGALVHHTVILVVTTGAVVLGQPGLGSTVHGLEEGQVLLGARVVGIDGGGELLGGSAAASQRGTRADAGKLQHEVQEVQQVTSLVDLHRGRLAKGHLPVEALHNGQHGKVGVLEVAEPPEGQGGRTCQQGRHDAARGHLDEDTVGGRAPDKKCLSVGTSG